MSAPSLAAMTGFHSPVWVVEIIVSRSVASSKAATSEYVSRPSMA
jgi:hypothetical protein